jgi:hypothetical protein
MDYTRLVQIWPGQTVTCLHTNSPGHIWTTLYEHQHHCREDIFSQGTSFCILISRKNFVLYVFFIYMFVVAVKWRPCTLFWWTHMIDEVLFLEQNIVSLQKFFKYIWCFDRYSPWCKVLTEEKISFSHISYSCITNIQNYTYHMFVISE